MNRAILMLPVAWLLLGAAAKAEDELLCAYFSREYVRIEVVTGGDPDLVYPTPDELVDRAMRVFSRCIVMEEKPVLPGSRESHSTERWAIQIAKLAIGRQGVAPATETDPADWRERCRDEYRTWRESDETVIRRVSKGRRVKCPYDPGATP